MRFSLTKPQCQNIPLPLVQPCDGVLEADLLQPVLVAVIAVPHLIHHAYVVPSVGIYRFVQADGINDGVHRHHHFLAGDSQLGGDLLHGRLPLVLRHQLLAGLQHPVGSITHAAADANGAVVPQIPAYFPYDHRNTYDRGKNPLHKTNIERLKRLIENKNDKKVEHFGRFS